MDIKLRNLTALSMDKAHHAIPEMENRVPDFCSFLLVMAKSPACQSINVMIINSQAFNAKGRDARRIYFKAISRDGIVYDVLEPCGKQGRF